MLGVSNLVKMGCYCQQTASPALAWALPSPSLVVGALLGSNQRKASPLGSAGGTSSLKDVTGVSGIWEAAFLGENCLPTVVGARDSWEGCDPPSQKSEPEDPLSDLGQVVSSFDLNVPICKVETIISFLQDCLKVARPQR